MTNHVQLLASPVHAQRIPKTRQSPDRCYNESGMFQNLGVNHNKEIINAAKRNVFFIGANQEVGKWAEHLGTTVQELDSVSWFRCNGLDGYLAWVDNGLQIRQTGNESAEGMGND
jgi:hypothetical protein